MFSLVCEKDGLYSRLPTQSRLSYLTRPHRGPPVLPPFFILYACLRALRKPYYPNTLQYHLVTQQHNRGSNVCDDILRRPRQETRDVGLNNDAKSPPQDFRFSPTSQRSNDQTGLRAYGPPANSPTTETGLALPVKAGWARTWQCRCRRYHLGRSKTKM